MPISEQELTQFALTLHRELDHAVKIVVKVMSACSFPIGSKKDFLNLFTKVGDGQSCALDGVTFTRRQAESYIPTRFFPVQDERDMLQKMYASLLHGKRMHQLQDEISFHQQHIDLAGAP
jgi:hypothetical protein